MAKQLLTVTSCDFDGTEGAQTVRFGVDGRELEIDLSAKREKAFREALAPYLDRARKPDTGGRVSVRSARAAMSDKQRNAEVREWAVKKGLEVAPRGRIPAAVFAEYDAEVGRR